MHTKEHLAALIPSGAALVLNTIRWAGEIRAIDDLKLPAAGRSAVGLKLGELKMAAQLIAEMTVPWSPQNYTDRFSVAIQTLVDKKLVAGDTEAVSVVEPGSADAPASNVLDLTELLAKSLAKRGPDAGAKPSGSPPKGADVTPRSPRKGATKPSARKRA